MPEFCRHGRFRQNCRICNKPEPKPERSKASGTPGTRARSTTTSSPRRSSAVVTRQLARAVEDGYEHELVPGLKASGDARRLAAELAFGAARMAELATDPPGLYADAAGAEDPEEALWLAFLIAHLSPLAGEDEPFAAIADARTTWASGEVPALGEGTVLGPRTTVDPKQPLRTITAYRAWAERSGSQAAAYAGDAAWTPERRFSRLFERLSLPGFARAGRVELLVSVSRLGLVDAEPAELRLGEAGDDTTLGAKRVFGIGDAFLLERRASDLAEAVGVPLGALDLALFNFGRAEDQRATMGARANADAELQARIEDALSV